MAVLIAGRFLQVAETVSLWQSGTTRFDRFPRCWLPLLGKGLTDALQRGRVAECYFNLKLLVLRLLDTIRSFLAEVVGQGGSHLGRIISSLIFSERVS